MPPPSTKPLSFLDIVNACDNTRVHRPSPVPSPYDEEKLVPLRLSPALDAPKIGLLRPIVIQELVKENERSLSLDLPPLWHLDTEKNLVSFASWCDTYEKRTAAMKELGERWCDSGVFSDVCGPTKWRAEMYPVYKDPFGAHDHPSTVNPGEEDRMNYAFEMERAISSLFGIFTYGVHMSIYKEHESPEGETTLEIWVPTRSKTKPTWPGFLDNSVAGGIPSGMPIFESLVKECMEEASIEEHHVRGHTKAVGCLSYFIRTATGWLQPEVEYVYDMKLPNTNPPPFEPKPSDGEVEAFELLHKDEVISRMRQGLFKPNCALVLIDLFMRKGIITPDNEGDYLQIITRLHGLLDYENW